MLPLVPTLLVGGSAVAVFGFLRRTGLVNAAVAGVPGEATASGNPASGATNRVPAGEPGVGAGTQTASGAGTSAGTSSPWQERIQSELKALAEEAMQAQKDLGKAIGQAANRLKTEAIIPVLQEFAEAMDDGIELIGQTPEAVLWLAKQGPERLGNGVSRLWQSVQGNEGQSLSQVLREQPLARTPEESTALTRIGLATLTVTSAAVGTLWFPPLYLLSSAGMLYLSIFVFQGAAKALVRENRVDANVLNGMLVLGAIVNGSFVAASVGIWFSTVMGWVYLRTSTDARESVSRIFTEQSPLVWLEVEGTEVHTALTQVTTGDRLVVRAGERVPVDGRVLSGRGVVDQHMITGEGFPSEKSEGDEVFAASVLLSGRLTLSVERAGADTAAAQLESLVSASGAYGQTLREQAEANYNRLTPAFLLGGALIWPIRGLDSALAVLWSVPGERMVVLAPLTVLSFIHVAAQNGILIRDGRALEALRHVDTVVFDKTGTLTLSQPTVYLIQTYGDLSQEEVLRLAAALELQQSHPIAQAVLACARERGLVLPTLDDAAVLIGLGLQARVEGKSLVLGSERMMRTTCEEFPAEAAQAQALAHQAGRSILFLAQEGRVVGSIELEATIRPEVPGLLKHLRAKGYSLVILSGDQEAPTRRLAEKLGIERYHAETLPAEKAAWVEKLQREGHRVCFVGDGINDAAALRKADVSISLQNASDVAMDVSQVLLTDGHLERLAGLFQMVSDLNYQLRVSRVMSTVPAMVSLSGTLLFGWGFSTAVLLSQVSAPFGYYSVLRPLMTDYKQVHETDVADTASAPSFASAQP